MQNRRWYWLPHTHDPLDTVVRLQSHSRWADGNGPTCAMSSRPDPLYPACHSWHQLGHLSQQQPLSSFSAVDGETPLWDSHGGRKFSGSEARTIAPTGVLTRPNRAGRNSTIFLGSQHPERGTEKVVSLRADQELCSETLPG